MILVDVFVPALDKSYDFSLDPQATVAEILEEILEMITRSEHLGETAGEGLMLANADSGELLPKSAVLASCSVSTGTRLMLV